MEIIYNPNNTFTLIKSNGQRREVANKSLLEQNVAEFFVDRFPVPTSVTPLQIRKAIRAHPARATILARFATLTEEEVEEWQFASVIDRNNAAIKALGFTENQIDNLFRSAATF